MGGLPLSEQKQRSGLGGGGGGEMEGGNEGEEGGATEVGM